MILQVRDTVHMGQQKSQGWSRTLRYHPSKNSSTKLCISMLTVLVSRLKHDFHVNIEVQGPKSPRWTCKQIALLFWSIFCPRPGMILQWKRGCHKNPGPIFDPFFTGCRGGWRQHVCITHQNWTEKCPISSFFPDVGQQEFHRISHHWIEVLGNKNLYPIPAFVNWAGVSGLVFSLETHVFFSIFTRRWFQICFIFTPIPGEMIQFV